MERLLFVSLGGAVGTGARYLVAGWAQKALGASFPYGTFAVNLVGSFLLGLLMVVGVSSESISPTLRIAITTGAMGGFTTYSTFSYETMRYVQEGAYGLAALNVGLTVVVCLVASFAGVAVGRLLVAS
ncbi:MAG: fluoride efflux transporter CrcB [Deltaproteobacteria bacterium]|nr:fluoride efflux transporter CrcB [Deltaproteobacteria bacterium]